MIALGWLFAALMLALAIIAFWEHGLFFRQFSLYLAAYATAHPLYLAGNALWYWPNLLTCTLLLLATNEAVDLRLMVLENEAGKATAVRRCGVSFGVALSCFVAMVGALQFNVPRMLHVLWMLTLAFCIGRAFVVWIYGVFESIPCPPLAAEHIGLLVAFLVPSLAAMLVRYDPQDGRLYQLARSSQTAVRIGVLLMWMGLFLPERKEVRS